MLVYTDLVSGDELLSDSFKYEEKVNGILWEVDGKWVQQGAIDVDIGANPSAEGGEDEGVDDAGGAKVVDIVDTFRLQEQPAFEKKALLAYLKKYIQAISKLIPADKQDKFKQNASDAVKYIVAKIKDLQYFVGESMGDDAGLVFAYYKEGKVDPTFIYFADGLKEVKC